MKKIIVSSILATALAASVLTISCTSSSKQSAEEMAKDAGGAQMAETASATQHEAGFLSFDEAVTKAKASKKLVLIDFYTDWCGWCKKMDKDVYPDKAVQAELEKYFTAAKINAESSTTHSYAGGEHSEQQIAQHMGVEAYPTIVFMTPNDEKIVTKIPGYVPAKEFAAVLRYFGSGAYQSQDFESWKKAQG